MLIAPYRPTVALAGAFPDVGALRQAIGAGAGDITVAWDSSGADSYDVGWDSVSHSGGDVNDPTLYPNRASAGASLSYTIVGWPGGTLYWSVRSVVGGELGAWAAEDTVP